MRRPSGAEDAEQDTELALQRSLLLERNSDYVHAGIPYEEWTQIWDQETLLQHQHDQEAEVRPNRLADLTITWRTQSRGCSMAGEGAAAGAPAARTAGAR